MTAAYRVLAAERKDIETVTVICADCNSEVSLLIDKAQVPYQCPSCSKPYGENVINALTALGRFQRLAIAAEQIDQKPLFRFSIRESA